MILVITSKTWTPKTPWELQREDPGDVWTVAGYYSATPDEAGQGGYRLVKREADPTKPAKKKGAA